MAERYNDIKGLAEYTVKRVTENPVEWMAFLRTAANVYRYPFEEQLLIYAQRPDATACASFDDWNVKMHCWIKRGAKGIALIDTDSPYNKLKYIFDVADVSPSRFVGRLPKLWKMQQRDCSAVINALEETYGETDRENPFDMRIEELSDRIAMDFYVEIMDDLKEAAGDELHLSDAAFEEAAERTLSSSICFMILSRCGFLKRENIARMDFSHIGVFSSPRLLFTLGAAVSDLACPVLREICRAVQTHEKNLTKEAEKTEMARVIDFTENALKRKLENQQQGEYNALKHESEPEIINAAETSGERKINETGVHTEWGLPDTEPEGERRAGGDAYEIWNDAEAVLEGEQTRLVLIPPSVGEAERTSSDHTGTGGGEAGHIDGTDGREGEGGREAEGLGSDDLGTQDEQHQSESGGDGSPGDSLLQITESDEEIVKAAESAAALTAASLTLIKGNPNKDNFRITDESLGNGGPKEKYHRNIEAIKMLQKIEAGNRPATKEEQEILSRYVGWGGIAEAFEENRRGWENEYSELKKLLSEGEYKSARDTVLNAHFTSPLVIRNIYETLERMGFKKGSILEPAMGVGNFFGMLPESMQESRLYGVELDSITGRIAKALYPGADIQIKGFEETGFQSDFFDAAIGNVPFGDYKVNDRSFDKYNFSIHDYFFAKSLEKVRSGGVIAFVTSRWTMDKKDESVRNYISRRAEFLGAVRLPNTAFKANAGTEATTDIIFLKKRDRIMEPDGSWLHVSQDMEGMRYNDYFRSHPEMVAGELTLVSGPYGMELTCKEKDGIAFRDALEAAISNIRGEYLEEELEAEEPGEEIETIPADPAVKNYSYCIVDHDVYFRENSVMRKVEETESVLDRIKGMVKIRDITQNLINIQLEDYPESVIQKIRNELNTVYDAYARKYGLLSSRTNKRAMNQDAGYCLLCSLERFDDDGKFLGKADMFYKRTIKKTEVITEVNTAAEALAVCLAERGKVDLPFMEQLSKRTEEQVLRELHDVIYLNPETEKWETADEYLSGNVREKLKTAIKYAEKDARYTVNVKGLEEVQPKELEASEIEIRLGATWVDPKYIEDFMREVFHTPDYLINRGVVGIQFTSFTGLWNVKGKNADYGNSLVNVTYGTDRANAYKILEDSLNLKDTRIYDTVIDDGKETRVLNKKETMIASEKQDAIKQAFKDWIYKDPDRRHDLVTKYNELFNSTRPREYDGSHLKFPGMSPDIELKDHQKNAIAHVLYGGNTLLAHCVGSGKTFDAAAAAMESKRLGLCQKSLFVVPNHLTEQWAAEFLRLYPGANILAATKKDFEPANRKKFCGRISTGEYDAVIIGHSQFEKIPLSKERQIAIVEKQIEEIESEIAMLKASRGERYTIKEMTKHERQLKVRLEKLHDSSKKDNVVTFEQLGVDALYVDESHYYKNIFIYTKMRNVAGIAQNEAQKSADMFAKCRYLDEITGGRGVTFATGTPLSNSMCELYGNMRYLQFDTLKKLGLSQFDAWASTFGETITSVELAPEGNGYRPKTRFARFYNLPELISLFKESADIQTSDMLDLPVPEAEYENVVLKPSEYQKEMVKGLADRAEKIRNRQVDKHEDNMLNVTNDGRKLALDQRLMNDLLPDDENSKTSVCVEKAFEIWKDTAANRSTQMIFSDLSTPKGDGSFNVYDDIKEKLIRKGVPEEEIAYIHEAKTERQKTELFARVRSGQIRFLLGSTFKMGAGTNVQDRLIALHHLDCPWRPSDLEQREGRIIRQGNQNEKVKIFRYVMENTFDSYQWQIIENKQKFIGQIMTSKSPVRSCEDIDDAALTYAEVKALATGNPKIKEKMELDMEVAKLKLAKANHDSQKYRLEDNITRNYPAQISLYRERIEGYEKDSAVYEANRPKDKDSFIIEISGKTYTDKKEAGTAIIDFCKELRQGTIETGIGSYAGMKLSVRFDTFYEPFKFSIRGSLTYTIDVSNDPVGNITKINNALEAIPANLEETKEKLANVKQQLESAKAEVQKPFEREAELNEKLKRQSELNAELNLDRHEDSASDMEDEPQKTAERAEVREQGKKARRPISPEDRPSVRKKLEEGRAKALKPIEATEEIKKLEKAL